MKQITTILIVFLSNMIIAQENKSLIGKWKVIEILNRFATLNKEIAISEFTLDIMDDEELRAKYTRDFMIATFSNPSVKEFLFWGSYKPMHPKAALVDEN